MLEIYFKILYGVFYILVVGVPTVLLYLSTNGIQKMIDAKKAGNRSQPVWIAETIIFGLLFAIIIVFYIKTYINLTDVTRPSVM